MQTQKQPERSTAESNGAIERIPSALESPQTKLVYLYLATVEAGTVEEVRDVLDVELISLYPVLDTLMSKGLVRKDGARYVCSTA